MYKDHIESLSKVPELPKEPANIVEEVVEEQVEEVIETPVDEEVAPVEENTIIFESEETEIPDKFNNISSLFE